MKKSRKNSKIIKRTQLKTRNLKKLETHQIGLNQILKPIIFFIISFALEIVGFAIFKFQTSSGSTQILPQYILFDIGFWLVICGLILCTHKNWISNLIFYFSLFVEVALFITNATLKSGFGYLFTFDMLELLLEMTSSLDSSFLDLKIIIFAVIGLAIFISMPLLIDKFCKNKKITLKKVSRSIFCLLFFLISSTVGIGCYTAQTALLKTSSAQKEISDDSYLYTNQQITDLAYQKFGSCGFYFKNLINTLFPNNTSSKKERNELLEKYKSSVKTLDKTASLYGDNLIVIMLESFEWFAIDPYNTPNLWALKTGQASENISNQAMVFTNYNSNNKTNVSENLLMLGFMPSVCNFNTKSNKEYATKYSLPNLLKQEGYTTSYFHNWDPNFYARGTTNKNLGFENVYTIDDFENENKSTKFNYYNLETDFANQFMDKIAPTDGKPFMSFYTTVSSHGLYNVINPKFEKYYKTYDKNLTNMKQWFFDNGYHYPNSEDMQSVLKHYKSAMMDADEMIGNIFKHLKENSLLENTNVVIYSDHQSFYHDLTNEIKSTVKSDYTSQESYVVPLMIYSESLSASTINSFCSPYDLYPTLCEMYGLPYNTINAQGKDMLSSEISETIYFSHLTGIYSPTCYSKNMQYIHKYKNTTDADMQNFKNRVCKFFEKQRILNTIYNSHLSY